MAWISGVDQCAACRQFLAEMRELGIDAKLRRKIRLITMMNKLLGIEKMKLRFLTPFRACLSSLLPAFLATCLSFFVVAVSHGAPDDADSKESAKAEDSGKVELITGSYTGTWESRDGRTGRTVLTLKVEGQKIVGHLAFWDGRYAGDDVVAKVLTSDDGSIKIEFKTKDGKMKSKAVFDGQSLTATYRYKYMVGRNRETERGDWTLESPADGR